MARLIWAEREQPILEAVAEAEEQGRSVNNDDISGQTGIGRPALDAGLLALFEGQYLTGTSAGAEELCYLLDVRLLERGRRATGQWPSEDAEQALLHLLLSRVEGAVDDADRTRWQRVLDAVKGVSGKALQEFAIAFVKHQAGI